MTAPRFRSTAAFTTRQRQAAPAVDRATFVIFSLDGQRYAVAAESVERVLRLDPSGATGDGLVEHGGRRVPVIDLRAAFRGTAGDVSRESDREPLPVSGQRTLVFSVHGEWVAAAVDAVYEVATIDAALVRSCEPDLAAGATGASGAARGRFTRHAQEVLVLDIVRVVRAVYEAAHPAEGVVGHVVSAPNP